MVDFNISEIARIVDGKLFNPVQISSQKISRILTDSRFVFRTAETLFFALIGPRNDGHDFINDLTEKGIVCFVISRPESINDKATFILVKNTTIAIQKLAAYNRHLFKSTVIGITGSNGKTIVKEWLYSLLYKNFNIARSPKSYNSQVGVPLSVLLLNENHNLGIFEAGISKPGEMANLEPIIQPETGVLTNIGDAHQQNFVSLLQKTREKLNLFKNSRKLIYNCDNREINFEVEKFCDDYEIERLSWTLKGEHAFFRFKTQRKTESTEISAEAENKKFTFSIPFTDDSSIENACHCFTVCYLLTGMPKELVSRFPTLETVAMRLEIKKGINNSLIINDYYNSDLNSLSIALSVLHQQAAREHLKKMVIISDIQQSGLPLKNLYEKVNEMLLEWKIDEITGIGTDISSCANVFSIRKQFYPNRSDFEKYFSRSKYKSSAILIKGARQFTFEKIAALLQQKAHQTVLEINLNALINNLNIFKSLLKPGTKIMVMVKAFSYGSGDVEIAKLLQYQHVDYLAVAVADEGVLLRNAGIQIPVVVMNPEQHSFQNIIDYRLEPNIYSTEILKSFTSAVSENAVQKFPIHLKLDTGMNRLGLKSKQEINTVIALISDNNLLKIRSVFSHLAAADDFSLDHFTHKQFEQFEMYSKIITSAFLYPIDRHILNSAGIERFPEKQYDMVRLGIGLYGVSATGLDLHPIAGLSSTISQVKTIQSDETIGYGRKGTVETAGRIAVVPLGYADGLDRKLSNGTGEAFVNGKKVPIIGNICMDMLMLDITKVEVKVGDKVEFFGDHISITEVAKKVETIPYEILTGISQRVKRVYLQE